MPGGLDQVREQGAVFEVRLERRREGFERLLEPPLCHLHEPERADKALVLRIPFERLLQEGCGVGWAVHGDEHDPQLAQHVGVVGP